MRICRAFLFSLLLLSGFRGEAQSKDAYISGRVVDENDRPLRGVNVTILGRQHGISVSDTGTFRIQVPVSKPFALVLTHTGYKTLQKKFFLSEGETSSQVFRMEPFEQRLEDVVVSSGRERQEVGLTQINPKDVLTSPSVTGGVEGLLKTLTGSNNELTSQYAVRGGNYDENLIYINDFEIYRPYLIRNGQQEGLSFINPELVRNISFYSGGFPARYGDKMSSALDVQYRKPVGTAGSVDISLLEQGIHLEGVSKDKNWSWLFGARTKTNQSLLSSQETKGGYLPSASDVQALLGWKAGKRIDVEALGILSVSKFHFIPESVQKSTAEFTPLYTTDLGLDIDFEGREKDRYRSGLLGLTVHHTINDDLKTKWMVSRYNDNEAENFDILGTYLFGERGFDPSSSDVGKIVNPLGAGVFQNYARNGLDIRVYDIENRGSYRVSNHFFQWGMGGKTEHITDHLNEWQMMDSAGYSIPYSPVAPRLNQVVHASNNIRINRATGFVQDNIHLVQGARDLFLEVGVRGDYNDLNREVLISPRGQLNYRPDWKRGVIFKASAGIYDQPPFYREMRRPDGSVNRDLKAQKSAQYVVGVDYTTRWGERPLRVTSEAYYKNMSDVVSYNIDNVRIIYSGENDARAFATGVETRLYTELVKDAESWLSVNVGRTMENLADDHYYVYTNASGEVIGSATTDQKVSDSIRKEIGWVRRPSDRLITLGLFLQDYLSTNKNFRVHLNMIYGSNMTYNIPDNRRFRNGLIIEPYFRVDIGFSALLLTEKSVRRSHSPFRSFSDIQAGLEVFNLIDRSNVISYQLIKDFDNNTFSIPNRLTPRLINLKLLARF